MDAHRILLRERHGIRSIRKWNLHLDTAHRIIARCNIQHTTFYNSGNLCSVFPDHDIVDIDISIHMTDLQKLRLLPTDLLSGRNCRFRRIAQQQVLIVHHFKLRDKLRTRRIHIGQHPTCTVFIQLDIHVNIIVTPKHAVFPVRILPDCDFPFAKHIIDIDHHTLCRTIARHFTVERPHRENRLYRESFFAPFI